MVSGWVLWPTSVMEDPSTSHPSVLPSQCIKKFWDTGLSLCGLPSLSSRKIFARRPTRLPLMSHRPRLIPTPRLIFGKVNGGAMAGLDRSWLIPESWASKKGVRWARRMGKIAILDVFLLQEFSKNNTEECLWDLAVRSLLVASRRDVSVEGWVGLALEPDDDGLKKWALAYFSTKGKYVCLILFWKHILMNGDARCYQRVRGERN